MTRRSLELLLFVSSAAPAVASAQEAVAPECQGTPVPAAFDEQAQRDFLANYPALVSAFAATHAPVAHAPGTGSVGVDLAVFPPLSCAQRLGLGGTKTEDTNASPLIPRLRAGFTQPLVDERSSVTVLAGYLPPVPVGGTRDVSFAGALSVGWTPGRWQLALRGHAPILRTNGEVASPFTPDEPAVDDLYVASTLGGELHGGYQLRGSGWVSSWVPYFSGGVLDVSTLFWIGDDSLMTHNLHPYLGPSFTAGVDAVVKDRLAVGLGLFAAPGGHRRMTDAPSAPGFGRYGRLLTARAHVAWTLGAPPEGR